MALVAHHQDPVRGGFQGGGQQGHRCPQILFRGCPVRRAADREQHLRCCSVRAWAIQCRARQQGGSHFRGQLRPIAVQADHLVRLRVFPRLRDQLLEEPVHVITGAGAEQRAVVPSCQLVPAEAEKPFRGSV
jgi:hypothetical protein